MGNFAWRHFTELSWSVPAHAVGAESAWMSPEEEKAEMLWRGVGKREPEKLGSVVAPGSICASWWDPALFVAVQPGEATFSPDALSCL